MQHKPIWQAICEAVGEHCDEAAPLPPQHEILAKFETAVTKEEGKFPAALLNSVKPLLSPSCNESPLPYGLLT